MKSIKALGKYKAFYHIISAVAIMVALAILSIILLTMGINSSIVFVIVTILGTNLIIFISVGYKILEIKLMLLEMNGEEIE